VSPRGAQRAVVTSALIVAGLYGYLKWSGKDATPLSQFAVAYGAVFMILALGVEVAPAPAGAFAILVAVGDLLNHAPKVFSQVAATESATAAPGARAGAASASQANRATGATGATA
jgi:hypothetical protein